MQEFYKKIKGCMSKATYLNEKVAKQQSKKLWKTRKIRRYPYKCLYCEYYHLTSKK